MYAPTEDDEISGLVGYIDQQLDAIRASVYGLTEEEAREHPCRSALSLGSILTHITWGMRGYTARLVDGPRTGPLEEADMASFDSSFELPSERPLADVLAEFDQVRSEFVAAVHDADPDATQIEPSAPWNGVLEPRPIRLRYFLVHQVEEFARHAGHADIIREQLDGQSVPRLVLTRAGAPAGPMFTPYEPRPGTIVV